MSDELPLQQSDNKELTADQSDLIPQSASPETPRVEVALNEVGGDKSESPEAIVPSKEDADVFDLIENALPSGTVSPGDRTKTSSTSDAHQRAEPEEQEQKSADESKTPTRAEVKAAMDSVAPSVRECAKGQSGRIVLEIVISGVTGRVMSASPVSAEHRGTPLGLCASRAVRLARFPKFNQERLVVKYPFDL